MAISFNSIPTNNRTQITAIEFDSSRALQGPGEKPYKVLIIGQMIEDETATSGLADPNVAYLVSGTGSEATRLFGRSSIIRQAITSFKDNNLYNEVYAIGLADHGSGVARVATFTVGAPVRTGTISLMVGGIEVTTSVLSTDTAAQAAGKLRTALLAVEGLPFSVGSLSTASVPLTAKNKGTAANDILIVKKDYGNLDCGCTISVAATTAGSTDPALATAIANIPDDHFDAVIFCNRESTGVNLLLSELDDRNGPMIQKEGILYIGCKDTVTNLSTLGNTYNSKYLTIFGHNSIASNPWEIVGAAVGKVIDSIARDPARPLHTLSLSKIIGLSGQIGFERPDRNTLLYNGISPIRHNAQGEISLDEVISTYKTNSLGDSDTSYLMVNTLYTLGYIRWDLRRAIDQRFPRVKLANDGTRYAAGQAIVTPKIMKAFVVGKFTDWETIGLVEGFTQFKNDLIVERNISNPNRLDIEMGPDLVNQLVMVGVKVSFLL